MRRLLSFILALLIGLSIVGKSVENMPKHFSLEINRVGCPWSCPVYTLKVDSSGKVQFEGIDYTEVTGSVESRLSDEQIKLLFAEIQKSNVFSLESDYGYESKNCNGIFTDQSGVLLTIEIDGKRKTIDHYQGCLIETRFWQKNHLEELSKFEDKIDEIVDTKQWIEGK
jgi:Domain of unknown function (DUF6438)